VDGAALAFGGLAVVSLATGVSAFVAFRREKDPALRRLRPAAGGGGAPDLSMQLRPLEAAAAAPDDARSRLRRQLTWGGLRGPRAPQRFVAAKLGLALAGLAAVLAASALRSEPLPMPLALAVWATAGGYFVPNLWLRSRVADRQRALQRALPDALDLLVTCVEAGLGLDAALQRVADETALAFPLLATELRLAFLETKAGIPRIEAMRRLADRTGVTELRSLAATLAQTEMFGTSVGAALRVQAEGIRIRRMQLAEERAAYVAVKMTFPLVLCILPSLFAVLLGPAIVNIAMKLFPLLGGQR
jgi:tight adherence protein C